MPVSVAQIAASKAKLSVPVTIETDTESIEEIVNLVYYPGRVTEKIFSSFSVLMAMGNQSGMEELEKAFGGFNETLCHIIASWDVLDLDGVSPFPIDPVRFQDLAFSFRLGLLAAIMGDIRPEALTPQNTPN